MKTESSYTSDVLRHVRQLRPEAIVWKLNDRTTASIPDAYIGVDGRSTWIEFKRSLTERPNIVRLLTPLQFRTLEKMKDTKLDVLVMVRTPSTWRVYTGNGGFHVDLTSSPKETAQWLINRLS